MSESAADPGLAAGRRSGLHVSIPSSFAAGGVPLDAGDARPRRTAPGRASSSAGSRCMVDRVRRDGVRSPSGVASGSWPLSRKAELISDTWEKAWGKLPTSRPASGSYSSESRPRSLRRARRRSNSSWASSLAPDHVQAVHQPERAGQEGALPPGQPVDRAVVGGAVAQDEPVVHELALHGFDGAHHPRVARREEAHQRDHEHAGVELVGAVVLREGADLVVVALLADLGEDVVAQRAPLARAAPRAPATPRGCGRPGRPRPRP